MDQKGNPKSIKIQDIEGFRNLKNAKRFAIDIGGTLTKIAYYSTISQRIVNYEAEECGAGDAEKFDTMEGGRLHFIKFETKYIASCLDFVRKHLVASREMMAGKKIKATGGGAYKYADLLQEKLGLSVDKEDELTCLIKGCNFLLKHISDEAFIYHRHGNPEYEFQLADPNIFPYLLVNIGSGVSILKVESEDKYERIGGTATGGGTFWGLGSLLTKAKGFDELLELAEKGDHRNADILVRDIYGGDYKVLGLPGDLIASSFGKVCSKRNSSHEVEVSEADVARSLLFTISNDIGQIACLYAMMHNLNKIYFGGYFLRNHPLSMHTISFAINFWSRGAVQSRFLRHEGYLGAIGAFLKGAEEWDEDRYSWLENYAGSSGLQLKTQALVMLENGVPIDQLELDRWQSPLGFCPLLADPANYIPDTVDLNGDHEAREYWLNCFETQVEKFVKKAIDSQPYSKTAESRGQQLKEKYLARLQHLQQQPFAYGNLTVRSLLDTIEHCLKEFDFPDPYLAQKQVENECALALLPKRLKELDSMSQDKRNGELITSVLAGNMFDWGAKEVVDLMEAGGFGFEQAREKIPERPWLVDNLDEWLVRLECPPHKYAAIFIDNSGVDFVLGILPFARELLRRGTKVILCANSAPALNDVTHSELLVLIRQASAICDIISAAVTEGTLVAMETAQGGPCLDLSKLDLELVNALSHVDLLVLEGMGRSVHTNLDTKFTCESLKLAVIKNRWLANRLGGPMFSVVCKYEKPSKSS